MEDGVTEDGVIENGVPVTEFKIEVVEDGTMK